MLHVSPTILETADLCNRKYYFERVKKLPIYRSQDYFTFGTILHEVVERFLRATFTGEVPLPLVSESVQDLIYQDGIFKGQKLGDPVNLYPQGWDDRISINEAVLIRKLVDKAIEEGILLRLPDAKVEREFAIPILDGLEMVGKIDYSMPWEVHDHKTSKSTRYVKTPEQLAETIQMMVYAKALLWEFGGERPDQIVLKHEVFIKDPSNPQIRKVETSVTVDEVNTFWTEKVIPLAEQVVKVRGLEDHWEVPGPKPRSNACSAYGGCPYQDICARVKTVDQYVQEIESIKKAPVEPFKGYSFSDLPKGMNLSERLAQLKAKTESTPVVPTPEPEPEPEPEAPKERELAAPPWAREDCTACHGTGWNKKGNPCGICTELSEIDPGDFEIQIKEGIATIDGHAFKGPEVIEEPKVKEKVEFKPVVPEPSATFVSKEEKKRGRKKKTFSLAINCIPVRGRGQVKDLSEVFKDLGKKLAEDKGKNSYYELNAFDRRDMLAIAVEEIVEILEGNTYIVRPDDPDLRAFVDVLRPYASEVWEPIASSVTVVNQGND